jgi:outer membrane protein TolC
MKKAFISVKAILITAIILWCGVLPVSGQTARAAEKEIILNYEDIPARVGAYNNTVRIGKLSLSEAQSALSQVRDANRDRRQQRESINEAIGETQDMIESGNLDDTALKEAQSLLSTLKQMADNLGSLSTSQLERTIEAVTLQNTQTINQLVNGARQLFIRVRQLQQNITLQQDKLKQAQLAAEINESLLAHGLRTPVALNEAQLQVSYAKTELTAQEHQLQVLLAQLRDYTGYKQGETLTLGEAPELDADFLADIDLEQDIEAALNANFALKLLHIDRVNADRTNAKRKIAIQIEQQEVTLRQAIKQKYDVLLETQAKLDLAATELSQARQQMKTAETTFKLGKISQNALDNKKTALTAKQIAWQNAVWTLVAEIEDYQAKINGLS